MESKKVAYIVIAVCVIGTLVLSGLAINSYYKLHFFGSSAAPLQAVDATFVPTGAEWIDAKTVVVYYASEELCMHNGYVAYNNHYVDNTSLRTPQLIAQGDMDIKKLSEARDGKYYYMATLEGLDSTHNNYYQLSCMGQKRRQSLVYIIEAQSQAGTTAQSNTPAKSSH